MKVQEFTTIPKNIFSGHSGGSWEPMHHFEIWSLIASCPLEQTAPTTPTGQRAAFYVADRKRERTGRQHMAAPNRLVEGLASGLEPLPTRIPWTRALATLLTPPNMH